MDQDQNNFLSFEAQEAKEGIIVSNDNFRDLIDEDEAFKDAIENRLLNYKIVSHKDKTEFLMFLKVKKNTLDADTVAGPVFPRSSRTLFLLILNFNRRHRQDGQKRIQS